MLKGGENRLKKGTRSISRQVGEKIIQRRGGEKEGRLEGAGDEESEGRMERYGERDR